MTKEEKDKIKAQIRKQIESQLLQGIDDKVEKAFKKWEQSEVDRIKFAVDAVLKPHNSEIKQGKGCSVCGYQGGKARGKWATPHSAEEHRVASER